MTELARTPQPSSSNSPTPLISVVDNELPLSQRDARLLRQALPRYKVFFLLQEYFEFIEREQKKDFEFMLHKFQAIAPMLTKVEGLVVNTNTGESPKLRHYYAHWEMKIFNSLTTVSYPEISLFNLFVRLSMT